MRIGVIGAGHAGVEAASAASKTGGVEAVLFSAESVFPYYRPRLVALALNQVEENAIFMHSPDWYSSRRIDLRLNSPVESFDTERLTIVNNGKKEQFDAIVIAIGGGPVVPSFAVAAEDRIFPLWNIVHARSIRGKIRQGGHVVVIGGGVIGIEAALRACDAGMRVTIIEKGDHLMPRDFSRKASEAARRCLEAKGVNMQMNRTVISADGKGAGVVIGLADGEMLESDFALVSIGVVRDLRLIEKTGLKKDIGVMVDTELKTSMDKVFACGDIAQINGKVVRCSAREAAVQGRIAGFNAYAVCVNDDMEQYKPAETPLTFKYKDFEMHSIGALPDQMSEEIMIDESSDLEYRVRVVRDGVTVGVQMVGNGKGFQKYSAEVQGAS